MDDPIKVMAKMSIEVSKEKNVPTEFVVKSIANLLRKEIEKIQNEQL